MYKVVTCELVTYTTRNHLTMCASLSVRSWHGFFCIYTEKYVFIIALFSVRLCLSKSVIIKKQTKREQKSDTSFRPFSQFAYIVYVYILYRYICTHEEVERHTGRFTSCAHTHPNFCRSAHGFPCAPTRRHCIAHSHAHMPIQTSDFDFDGEPQHRDKTEE